MIEVPKMLETSVETMTEWAISKGLKERSNLLSEKENSFFPAVFHAKKHGCQPMETKALKPDLEHPSGNLSAKGTESRFRRRKSIRSEMSHWTECD
jgi:hypothetical protein